MTEHVQPRNPWSLCLDIILRERRLGALRTFVTGFPFGAINIALPGTYLLAPFDRIHSRAMNLQRSGGTRRFGPGVTVWFAAFYLASAIGVLSVLPAEVLRRCRALWLWTRLRWFGTMPRSKAQAMLASCEPLDPKARESILERLPPP